MYHRYWDSHSSSSSSLQRRLPCRPTCTQRTSITSYNWLVWLRHPPLSFVWEPLPLLAWPTGDSMNQSDLDDVLCKSPLSSPTDSISQTHFTAWLLWSRSVDRHVLGFDCVSVIAQLPFLCINNVCRCMFSFISCYMFLVMYICFIVYVFFHLFYIVFGGVHMFYVYVFFW